MHIILVSRSVLFPAFAAASLPAADVNGKWAAQAPARGGEVREITCNFKAEGDHH